MARLSFLILGMAALFAVCCPAAAQQMDLSGAWSGQSPGQGGYDYNTLLLNPNGTYVRVSRAPNGWLLRYEGVYSARYLSPNQVILTSQIQRWAPTAMCSQILSRGIRNCVPVSHPGSGSIQVAVLSPTQIQIGGMSMVRDSNPVLLNAVVPAQYVQNEAAPALPTMPTLHPYDQSAVHRGMNDFIYGRLRGCSYKAVGSNGTLYSGCDR